MLFSKRIITLKNLNRLVKWGVPCSSEVSRRNFKHAGVTDRIHFWGMRSGTADGKDIVILSVFPNSDFGKTVVENHIGSKHQVSTKLGLHFTVTWLVYRHKIHVHYRSKFFFIVTLCDWHEWSWKKNGFFFDFLVIYVKTDIKLHVTHYAMLFFFVETVKSQVSGRNVELFPKWM